MNPKTVSAEEAVDFIRENDTVAIGGFIGMVHPEELTLALEKSFLKKQKPKNLTIVYAAGQGDGKEKGINHLAHEGLVKRVIGGHWGLAPKMGKLAIENKIEAYNFPQGVISHLYREIAGGRIGVITHVGLKTFVDPRKTGGKLNKKTSENLVELINIAGQEKLFYKSFPINVALIRGTTADRHGNISMEKEAGSLEVLAMAQAAKNSGGIVIAQVERISEQASNPYLVKVPSIFVDYIVEAKSENHWQTFGTFYNPAFSGESKIEVSEIPEMKLDERKIISRRAFLELKGSSIINLGIGMPEGVAIIANEENASDMIKITVEAGAIGGVPAGGLSFGASFNPEAIIDQPYQFDFYDGGGLDIAFLGMAQTDRHGNVNVSKFGSRLAGCGGFINITQNAKEIVFCGTFTSGGLEIEIINSEIKIKSEGLHKKFISEAEHITFSGEYASDAGQRILYVTERAVFKLNGGKLELTEIAPGIDLNKDILSQMDFKPEISENLKIMKKEIFQNCKMTKTDY
jgi:propionate CoA-transferase